MKTLLVPLDFSDAGDRLLEKAAELASGLGARLLLFHVIEPVATAIPVGASMDVLTASPPLDPVDASVAETRLARLAEPLQKRGLEVACKAVVGLPAEDIVAAAEDEGADFIVVASHGHGALYHLFSGSVVTGVLKHAKCPVIVVPARGRAKS